MRAALKRAQAEKAEAEATEALEALKVAKQKAAAATKKAKEAKAVAGSNEEAAGARGAGKTQYGHIQLKVDWIQDALRHSIYFMQGMMEEYAARNVALEERVRYLEGLAGVEQEGEPSQKTEKMLLRDQDARDMETSADELKTAAESETKSSEDKQTREARWDMDHEEAEKRLLAAVARLSTAPITAPLPPVAATTETTPSAGEEPQ
ncbi:hypothetical protein C0991_011932, partial [Blastosporella zonata]